MTAKEKITSAMFIVGGIMTLAGAAAYITAWREIAPYIYTVGAGLVALAQIGTTIETDNKTLRRLRIQQIFGAILLVLTGMFMMYTHGNEWIACLTIAAVLELYTAFRIPQEEEKEKNSKSN
jgi:4-hydroxybenzoate polyprenyltransferase